MVLEKGLAKASEEKKCDFCGKFASHIYYMGEYPICKCSGCGTGFVYPMPDSSVLEKMYKGFLPNLDASRQGIYKEAVNKIIFQIGITPGKDYRMLDIGGGGGFFVKAFEELGYGQGTYVDLDPYSCRFAREELGLEQVYNCNAENVREYTTQKYDFILCRHLIEHLVEPTLFIERVFDNLTTHGIFLLQFPNGDSLEYLPYIRSNLRKRLSSIRQSNEFSKLRTIYIVLSGGMLHGMDPPRHLWAITPKGIRQWASQRGIWCTTFTRTLGDPAFSPHYKSDSSFSARISDFLGQRVMSRVRGGTHLVAILKRES